MGRISGRRMTGLEASYFLPGDSGMPRGDKSSYIPKQKRQTEHIEKGYEHRGVSEGEAERRAWATVNKETGGGMRAGVAPLPYPC